MTAVDFVPFVEKLAQVSGEAIMPYFRTAFAMEDKSCGGVFDPVTEADRAAEAETLARYRVERRGFILVVGSLQPDRKSTRLNSSH